ncbi:hypothetical protein BGZ94_002803 [Podila epigama]|nr:hypothetical protein BGZ94_002803 [Podila epigama]
MPSPSSLESSIASSSTHAGNKRILSDISGNDLNSDKELNNEDRAIFDQYGYNPNKIASITAFIEKHLGPALLDNNKFPRKSRWSKRPFPTNSVWLKAGMDEFIDWYSNPENYEKLQIAAHTFGRKKCDVHREAVVELGLKGFVWTVDQIKHNIQQADKSFRKAMGIWKDGLTGRHDRSAKALQLLACPYFDKLCGVLSSCAPKNHPPPYESVYPEKYINLDTEDEPLSDIENDYPEENTSDPGDINNDYPEENTSDPSDIESPAINGEGVSCSSPPGASRDLAAFRKKTNNEHGNKKRKNNDSDTIADRFAISLKEISERYQSSADSVLRNREVYIFEREKEVFNREKEVLNREKEVFKRELEIVMLFEKKAQAHAEMIERTKQAHEANFQREIAASQSLARERTAAARKIYEEEVNMYKEIIAENKAVLKELERKIVEKKQ